MTGRTWMFLALSACGDPVVGSAAWDGDVESSTDPDASDPPLADAQGPDGATPPLVCVPIPSTCPKTPAIAGSIADGGGSCEYYDDAGCSIRTLTTGGYCGTDAIVVLNKRCLSMQGYCPTSLDAGATPCAVPNQWCPLQDGECVCAADGGWDCRAQLPTCPRPTPSLGATCDVDGGECVALFAGSPAGAKTKADPRFACCGTWQFEPQVVKCPPP